MLNQTRIIGRVILILFVLTFINGCDGEEEETVPIEKTDEHVQPDQIIFGFKLKETVLGDLKWKATAKTAYVYDENEKIIADSICIDFYRDLELYSTLTADSGLVYQRTNNMEAYGNVVIVTTDDRKLMTERIFWDNRQRKIYSNDFVTVIQKYDILTGVGFETDPDLKDIRIKNNVKARIRKIEHE